MYRDIDVKAELSFNRRAIKYGPVIFKRAYREYKSTSGNPGLSTVIMLARSQLDNAGIDFHTVSIDDVKSWRWRIEKSNFPEDHLFLL